MAVITRYIVVRNGVELDKVFEIKKEADAYDKMLDAAESLADLIKQGDLPVDLDAKSIEEISIYLAKNAPDVTAILRGVKPWEPAKPASEGAQAPAAPAPTKDKKPSARKPGTKRKKK